MGTHNICFFYLEIRKIQIHFDCKIALSRAMNNDSFGLKKETPYLEH